MSIELVRETVHYMNMVGEGAGQTMVGGDIVVGERNQEILSMLHMDGKADITATECLEDKVVLEGRMSFELLYSTIGNPKAMNKTDAVSSFNHTLQVPGARAGMLCGTEVRLDHISYEQTNSRKVKVSAIVSLTCRVYQKSALDAVVDIRAQEIQVLRSMVTVDEFIAESSGQSVVKARMELPEHVPSPVTVLKRDIEIVGRNVNIGGGRAFANAAARIRYVYDDGNGELHTSEQEVPFNSELRLSELREDMRCDIGFRIEEAYNEIREEEGGTNRGIETELVVECKGRVYDKREIDTVIDAYSPLKRYEMERETLRPMSFFAEGKSLESLDEKLEIPMEKGQVRKIHSCIAKPVLTEIRILEDKVTAEGIVNCCLIFEKDMETEMDAAVKETCLASHVEEIPFKTVIDIPGAKIDMLPEAGLFLGNIGIEKLQGNTMTVRMGLGAGAKVYSRAVTDLSIGAIEAELPANIANMPSLVIYTVQPGDTLWKIAKKFNTVIEDIVELNEIEEPDLLQASRRLLIPKKSFMK